jgi:hypothetical protein
LVFVRAAHVVEHDERGLLLWIANGCPMAVEMSVDGLGLRDMSFAEWVRCPKVVTTTRWRGPDILMLLPPEAAHSVWWFWDARGVPRRLVRQSRGTGRVLGRRHGRRG